MLHTEVILQCFDFILEISSFAPHNHIHKYYNRKIYINTIDIWFYCIFVHCVAYVVFILCFCLFLYLRSCSTHGASQVNGSGPRRPQTLMTPVDRKLVSPAQNLTLTIHKDSGGYGMKVSYISPSFVFLKRGNQHNYINICF